MTSRALTPNNTGAVRGRLRSNLIKARKETVYRMLSKRYCGKVPCFVCGLHVTKADATLEHIKPQSLKGTDDMSNLSISHMKCNSARGNNVNYVAPQVLVAERK